MVSGASRGPFILWTGSTQTQLAREATRQDSTHRHNIERLPERETKIETQCLNSETHVKMKNFDFKTKKKKREKRNQGKQQLKIV